jgi:hypothetical protein
MITEVLETVRDLQRVGKDDNWRVGKTMLLVADLYQQVTGKRAPSMKELVTRRDEQAAADAINRYLTNDGNDMTWQPRTFTVPPAKIVQTPARETKVEPLRPFDETKPGEPFLKDKATDDEASRGKS